MSDVTTPIVYGAAWCGYCQALKSYLESLGVPYDYRDVDDKVIEREMLEKTNGTYLIPTLIAGDTVVQNPNNEKVKELLGMSHTVDTADTSPDEKEIHDVIMIGAGPAALSAAIYTTREDIETVLYEKGVIGGLAAITDWVDNYPGFPKGLAGLDLAEDLRKQAERFGADIRLGEVLSIADESELKKLETTDGDVYARAVLIATGSDYKKLGIPGEDTFYGRGVHYCATCDGAFYRDKHLVVVGGGNSAAQEAVFLTRFATKIDVLVRSDKMRASEILQQDLEKHKDKITIHYNTTTDEIVGSDSGVTEVVGTDKTTNEKVTFKTDGVFVFIGLKPNTEFLHTSDIELDEIGMVKTFTGLETSMKGVFCAGDVRSGATMQIASATGEGATAALMMRKYLEEHERAHAEVAAPK
jgi:thioredoxin reductase (NADPH)